MKRPVLLYMVKQPDIAELMRSELQINKLDVDTIDHAALRDLGAKKVGGHFQVMLVSDERLLRGIDYRAPGTGIALIVAASFSTNRALAQALGRVGRFGESCERVQLAGLTVVSEWSDNLAFNKLFRLANDLEMEKKLAQQAKKEDRRR